MGVIKSQSIKSTIYTYIGVFIGFINSTLLMPRLLSKEQVGMLSLVNSLAGLFVGFFALGVPLIAVKLFPTFRNPQNKHNGFFSFMFLMTVIGTISGILIYILFEDYLLTEKNDARNFSPFFLGFCILFIAKLAFKNFDSFIRMMYKTVLGAFLEGFIIKILATTLLLSFWYYQGYDFKIFFLLYVSALAIPGIVQGLYIFFIREFSLDFRRFSTFASSMKQELITLSIYGLLGTLGSIVVLEVDKLMISNMIGLEATGIYSIAFFFGLFINIPARGLKRVAQALVSDLWRNNDVKSIQSIYRKSCNNQFLLSLYLFLGVWLNIDYVFQFLPEGYSDGKYVILFIGLGQLADMITGVNTEIIASSKYYRFNTYFIGSLIVLVVLFNYLLIPPFGIEGAAMASALAMILVNGSKFFFLNYKLNFQPLNSGIVKILVIGIASLLIIQFALPVFDNPFVGILTTGTLLTILYWVPSLLLGISEDINQIVQKYIKF